MKEFQLIYASTPFGYDDLALMEILSKARKLNARDGITGSLICREDLYLQLLEGPGPAVEATFNRILRDGRHANVAVLWSGDIEARMFPEWTMRHDPAQSWMWSREDVARGAITETPATDIRAIFQRLATTNEQPPPAKCPMSRLG